MVELVALVWELVDMKRISFDTVQVVVLLCVQKGGSLGS